MQLVVVYETEPGKRQLIEAFGRLVAQTCLVENFLAIASPYKSNGVEKEICTCTLGMRLRSRLDPDESGVNKLSNSAGSVSFHPTPNHIPTSPHLGS